MGCFTIGSILGSYLPSFFGINIFSYTSILLGALGGIIGTYIGFQISKNF
jgi:hypothetical protein